MSEETSLHAVQELDVESSPTPASLTRIDAQQPTRQTASTPLSQQQQQSILQHQPGFSADRPLSPLQTCSTDLQHQSGFSADPPLSPVQTCSTDLPYQPGSSAGVALPQTAPHKLPKQKQEHTHSCTSQARPVAPTGGEIDQQQEASPSRVSPSPQSRKHKRRHRAASRQIQPFCSPHQVYPTALATHDQVVANERLFFDTLHTLHAALGIKPTIPKLGGKDLDLHMLYKEVTTRGGLEAVIKDRKWKEITVTFNFPRTITSASFVLRKYYIGLLYHYEQVYFFGAYGRIMLPPVAVSTSSPVVFQVADADINLEVSNEVESRVKKTKRIIDSAQALGVDPASSIGAIVTGSIDGKFDYGYLVTVMVGTRKMRGVLYHVPCANAVPQNASVPVLMNNIGSDLKFSDVGPRLCMRKRKTHISRKDPNAPRQNRTGYNFFFAEQRAKLKTLQPGKDTAISKMIGDLWNKLSEDEKSPYQERGLKDKERYEMEMREYKERLKIQPYYQEDMNGCGATIETSGKHELRNGDASHD